MTQRRSEPLIGETIEHIQSLMPSLIPSAQRVARICVERPQDVVEMSGADLAEAAATSAATVSRMSKSLGFRGFQHLRLTLVRDLGTVRPEKSQLVEGRQGWLDSLAQDAAALLAASLSSVNVTDFDAAAQAIADAPRVVLVSSGGSHPATQAAALSFVANGRPCEAPLDVVAQQLTASGLHPGDVCLAVSGSGANVKTVAAASAATAVGATVIGVTSFARSPLAAHCTFVLVAGAGFRAWDPDNLGNGLAQLLLLTALRMAVAERMQDVANHALTVAQDDVLGKFVVDIDGSDETEWPST